MKENNKKINLQKGIGYFLLTILLMTGVGAGLIEVNTRKGDTASTLVMEQHMNEIAKKPHGTQSGNQEKVKEYLLSQIESMGYTPEIGTTTWTKEEIKKVFGISTEDYETVVTNHILVKKEAQGKKEGSILVITNYDSSMYSYGAAQSAVSAATMLESMKLLKEQSVNHDIYYFFEDASTVAPFGAYYLMHEKPEIFEQIGMILQITAEGNQGPVIVSDTSNISLAELNMYSKSSHNAIANSYHNLFGKMEKAPSSFTMFKEFDKTGIVLSAVQNKKVIGTMEDSVVAFNRDTMSDYLVTGTGLIERLAMEPGAYAANVAKDANVVKDTTVKTVFFTLPFHIVVSVPSYILVIICTIVFLLAIFFFVYTEKGEKKYAIGTHMADGVLYTLVGTVVLVSVNIVVFLLVGNRVTWIWFFFGISLILTICFLVLSTLIKKVYQMNNLYHFLMAFLLIALFVTVFWIIDLSFYFLSGLIIIMIAKMLDVFLNGKIKKVGLVVLLISSTIFLMEITISMLVSLYTTQGETVLLIEFAFLIIPLSIILMIYLMIENKQEVTVKTVDRSVINGA